MNTITSEGLDRYFINFLTILPSITKEILTYFQSIKKLEHTFADLSLIQMFPYTNLVLVMDSELQRVYQYVPFLDQR